ADGPQLVGPFPCRSVTGCDGRAGEAGSDGSAGQCGQVRARHGDAGRRAVGSERRGAVGRMTLGAILFAVMMTIMIFFLVINSFHAILLMCAVPELWSHWQLADDEYFHALVGTDALPPISVIASLQRSPMAPVEIAAMLLALDYPRFEVVLVVDGAAADHLGNLVAALQLYEVPPAFTINVRTRPVR